MSQYWNMRIPRSELSSHRFLFGQTSRHLRCFVYIWSPGSCRVSTGLMAAVLQLGWGTKYKRFPRWLDRWLCSRKQLGLLSFLCAGLHAVYSACLTLRQAAGYRLLNAAYQQVSGGLVTCASSALEFENLSCDIVLCFIFRWKPVWRTPGWRSGCGGLIFTCPLEFWDSESSPCSLLPHCPRWETPSAGGSLHLFRSADTKMIKEFTKVFHNCANTHVASGPSISFSRSLSIRDMLRKCTWRRRTLIDAWINGFSST